MNIRVFTSTDESIAFSRSELLVQGLRVSGWTFALLSLCFYVPDAGLKFYHRPDAFPLLWVLSGLPVVAALEGWYFYRQRLLSYAGLFVFVVLTLLAAGIGGLGLPSAYVTYIRPSANAAHMPYLMIAVGGTLWLFLLSCTRLFVRDLVAVHSRKRTRR